MTVFRMLSFLAVLCEGKHIGCYVTFITCILDFSMYCAISWWTGRWQNVFSQWLHLLNWNLSCMSKYDLELNLILYGMEGYFHVTQYWCGCVNEKSSLCDEFVGSVRTVRTPENIERVREASSVQKSTTFCKAAGNYIKLIAQKHLLYPIHEQNSNCESCMWCW